jgi:hypothetical protein
LVQGPDGVLRSQPLRLETSASPELIEEAGRRGREAGERLKARQW